MYNTDDNSLICNSSLRFSIFSATFAGIMKHYASVILFIAFIASSAVASVGSYRATEQEVVENLNTALRHAMAEKKSTWLTCDTIANYRRMQGAIDAPLAINMRNETLCRYMGEALRDETFIQLRLIDAKYRSQRSGSDFLCSDTLIYTDKQSKTSVAIRGIAQCSQAKIFAMSDQRISITLFLLAFAIPLMSFLKRDKEALAIVPQVEANTSCVGVSLGGIVFSNDSFFDREGKEIHLTPMQRKLLTMFFQSPNWKLSQSDICNSLWPKKDDASETLYALITRTKKAIGSRYGIKIEVDRDRSYSLSEDVMHD